MIEITGNIWKQSCDYRIITTNGYVKSNGWAVMGRGVALQAARRFSNLPQELGLRIKSFGNDVHLFSDFNIITFPVKHNWYEIASISLIQKSTHQLIVLIKTLGEDKIYCMTRPGCNNGRLKWEDVKPIISILPDNVKVINLT